jgi:hypothetical protein
LIELAVNSSHRIDILVVKDDQAVAPDAAPTYRIYDADTEVLLKQGTASVDTADIGRYYVSINSSITNIDRTLRVEWIYSISTVPVSGYEYTLISTPYAEIGEIIDELGLGTEPTDLNFYPYSKLRSCERIARLQIDNYTGRNFGQRESAQVVYGNGSDTLLFTETMTNLTKIEQDDVVIYDAQSGYNALGYDIVITETGQGVRITNLGDSEGSLIAPSAQWYAPGPHFVNGSRYKIYGTTGYKYVPMPVKQAAVLLINDNLFNDVLWRQKYISEFNTGQMQVKLRDTAFTGTGNLLADELLDPFKITGIVVI